MIPKAPKHKRIKDTKKRAMNSSEKAHAARLASMGCVICGKPATIHHERRYGAPTDHRLLVPLCPEHHQIQWGKESLEYMGHEKFEEMFKGQLDGLTLLEWAKREWEVSQLSD